MKYFAHSEIDSSFIKEYASFYDTLSDLVRMNVEFEFIEKKNKNYSETSIVCGKIYDF